MWYPNPDSIILGSMCIPCRKAKKKRLQAEEDALQRRQDDFTGIDDDEERWFL